MKISIVTINFNNAAGLKNTLQSVAQQDYPGLEHVVYDGQSEDNSIAVICEYGQHLSQWRSEKNGGIYFNQNRGCDMASGDFVLFLNSGDYLYESSSISNYVARNKTGYDIYYGDLWLMQDDKLSLKQYPDVLPDDYFIYETLPHPASLIRRELLRNMGGYDEGLKICSDWKFFLQAYTVGARFQHVEAAPSVFGLDGVSSKSGNRGRILSEQIGVLQQDFKAMLPNFLAHHHLTLPPEQSSWIKSVRTRIGGWIKQ